RRRMRSSSAPGREPLDQGRQLGGCLEPPFLALPHDGARQPTGLRLVSVLTEHTSQLSLGPLVEGHSGSQGLPLVHPHVERTISLKTESAVRLIELRRADPKVEKNPVATVRRNALRQFREIRSPDFKAAGETRFIQAPRGCFHGRAIAIEAKQPSIR